MLWATRSKLVFEYSMQDELVRVGAIGRQCLFRTTAAVIHDASSWTTSTHGVLQGACQANT